jgi:hypothetical protein
MRTLFWKIFLSFWGVLSAAMVGSFLFRPEAPVPVWQNFVSDAFAIQAQNLVQAYETGGEPELSRFVLRVRQGSYNQIFLFNAAGSELAGQKISPQARDIAERAGAHGRV